MSEERKLIVREMKKEDLKRVYEIASLSLLDAWTYEDLEYEFFNNDFSNFMLLTYADVVIGFVDFWITFDSATIVQIAIDPTLQNKKLGSILFSDTIERIYGVEEVRAITLEVRTTNDKAIHFYLKHGFQIINTKRGYYRNGNDAYYMVRLLRE